jgi:hypothetical protein
VQHIYTTCLRSDISCVRVAAGGRGGRGRSVSARAEVHWKNLTDCEEEVLKEDAVDSCFFDALGRGQVEAVHDGDKICGY